jgi:hypothetical protein
LIEGNCASIVMNCIGSTKSWEGRGKEIEISLLYQR